MTLYLNLIILHSYIQNNENFPDTNAFQVE